jgi:iron complex outermembrane receptor protein
MEVMQVTGAEFNVSMRGDNQLNANKLLVLVDGRSIYLDVQGTINWKMLPVTLPEIKRIEVLKGPASAVYGFNAFDGVINIITKSPEEMRGNTLQFGGGEFGTISSAAVHAGTQGKLGYRLSVGHDQNQQWRNSDALAFRMNRLNGHTEYSLGSDSKLSVSGGLADANRYDGPIVGAANVGSTIVLSYANVAYERPDFFIRSWWYGLTANSVEAFPAVNNILSVAGTNGAPNLITKGNTYNVEAQHSVTMGMTNKLTYGLNYRHNTLSGTFVTALQSEDRFGLYLQDEWRPTEKFLISAGIRYDLDTFINPTLSPRVALLYKPADDHTFRAAVSIAYRPPTVLETYVQQQLITTLPAPLPSPPPSNIRGSTSLSPERIVSYELGYQGWYWRHRLRARLDLFFNHLSSLIDTTSFGSEITFVNGREADIYGGEAGVELLVTRWLSGFANYAYQEVSQNLTGDVRRSAPRFKGNAGFRADWENGMSGEVTYHHYGSTTYPLSGAFESLAPLGVVSPSPRVGSYNLLNMRAGYRFWQQKAAAGYMRDAEIAVSVFNALNDEHKEHPLGDLISRRVMGWLTVRF